MVEKAEAEVDEVGVGMPVASLLPAGGKEVTGLGGWIQCSPW